METTIKVQYKLVAPLCFTNLIDQSLFDHRGQADEMLCFARSHYAKDREVLATLKVERITTIVEQDYDSKIDYLKWAASGLRDNEYTRIHWKIHKFDCWGYLHKEQSIKAQFTCDIGHERPTLQAGEDYKQMHELLNGLLNKHDQQVSRSFDELKSITGAELYYAFINALADSRVEDDFPGKEFQSLKEPFVSREKGGKLRRERK